MLEVITSINNVVVSLCQVLAIVIILIGIIKAMYIYVKNTFSKGAVRESIESCRMELGHSFSLGLSFLIGGSILRTTLAPTWEDIGQLAAIIAIRTVLNYFLMLEISKIVKVKKDKAADGKAAC